MRMIRDDLGRPRALEHEGRRLAVTRRAVLMGAGAAGALTLVNLPLGRAAAATDVFFLGWQGYDDPYKVGGFLEQNGITLQTTYINTIEDIITKLRSGGMGSVDLTTLISQYVQFSAEAGLLEAIEESKVPNLGKRHPRFKEIDEILRVDGKLYGVPFTFSSIPLLYNPALVLEPPTSWMDLLKPEYEGKVAPWPDAMSMIVVWSRVATGTDTPTQLTYDELDKTVELMIKLKKHSRALPGSIGEAVDLFARGEVVMGMGWEPVVTWAADKGAKLEIAYPSEGTFGYVDTVNIAKEAPNLELDHALVDHCLSTEAQVEFGNTNILGVVNEEAMKGMEPSIQALYSFDDLDKYFDHARVPAMFPLEKDGTHATWDEVLAAHERYMQA